MVNTTSLSIDAATTLVQAFIACRDYCNSLFCGITDNLFTVGAKCGSPTYNRQQAKRPRYASTQRAPLASRASACRCQAGGAGLQSTSRSDGAVPRRRDCQLIVSNVGRRRLRHLHRSTNKHATRWQKLCGRWSTAMEQSASRTASARDRTGGISTAAENVFVYVRHRRLVTFVFERLINIRLLLLLLLD